MAIIDRRLKHLESLFYIIEYKNLSMVVQPDVGSECEKHY